MDDLSIWHLHDAYSMDEAAWLIAGESPIGGCQDEAQYSIYRGTYGALEKTIHDFGGNRLKAKVDGAPLGEHIQETDPFISREAVGIALELELAHFCPRLDSSELCRVTISKPDLIQWLDDRKYYPPFFFPEKSGEPTPTEKENIHISPDPVATLASDALPPYLAERLAAFVSLIPDAYKLRLANPKANKATLIDLMCDELGVKDLEARLIDVMLRPPQGK